MVKIISASIVNNYEVRFTFSDGFQKNVDFTPFITKSDFTKPLLDRKYFKKVMVYENGRGIFWPNGYDFCPDNIRYYLAEEENLHLKNFAVHDKPNK